MKIENLTIYPDDFILRYDNQKYVFCVCDCGTRKYQRLSSIKSGAIKSCGCVSARATALRNTTHGFGKRRGRRSEYGIWGGMKDRCNNPLNAHYERYGGRGIKVCERWDEFVHFLEDVGPRPSPLHTLDRIDNDSDYCPENCRWATRKAQSNNRGVTIFVEYEGKSLTISDWSKLTGIGADVIRRRVRHGWPPKYALTLPLFKGRTPKNALHFLKR